MTGKDAQRTTRTRGKKRAVFECRKKDDHDKDHDEGACDAKTEQTIQSLSKQWTD